MSTAVGGDDLGVAVTGETLRGKLSLEERFQLGFRGFWSMADAAMTIAGVATAAVGVVKAAGGGALGALGAVGPGGGKTGCGAP